jgi:multiphosphoryl transfer protein
MVSLVIVSHSAKIAEGVRELARQMGGADVAMAAAGGTKDPDDPIGTDAFRVKEAIEEVWSPDGVLVLMDLGSAVLSAETALDFLEPPADPSRVLLCEAPLVEGAVAAATTARIGGTLEEVAAEARAGLVSKAEHLGVAPAPSRATSTFSELAETYRFTVPNRLGLHLRPAGRLVEMIGSHEAVVEVTNLTTGVGPAPGRSVSRVSALGALQGHEIELRAEGPGVHSLFDTVARFVENNLGDTDDEPAPTSPAAPAAPGRLGGIGASPGVTAGPARRLVRPGLVVPQREVNDVADERSLLDSAISDSRADTQHNRNRLAADSADIFAAHLLILDDEEMAGAARARIDEGVNAERAWMDAVKKTADSFRALDDPYQAARAEDVEAVGYEVLARLLGEDPRPRLTEPGVLVADDLTPAETASLDRDLVAAIVTSRGAATSHSAIIARAIGVPAVVGVGPFDIAEGTMLVVDGDAGTVVVDASAKEVAAADEVARAERKRRDAARRAAAAPALTRDGTLIEVAANIGSVADAAEAIDQGADGVGLLRTEFLFLDRDVAPPEEEQEETYRRIAETLDGRPLVLRTLDVGGDKPLPFVPRLPEANPFLGVRGLRLGLAAPELLTAQLRAALRVASDHQVRIMFPMVATVSDWEQARAAIAKAADAVGGLPAGVELGVMVEVPSLPLIASHLAPVVDFFSVGTNDLVQYAMAAERGNPALTEYTDPLHPAVLRLIDLTCQSAKEHGRWVGVCGELSADPAATAILIGLGVTELSMNPIAIPTIKETVRRIDTREATSLANRVLDLGSATAVRAAVKAAS